MFSKEVSGLSTVFSVLSEGSAELGNTFWSVVTEVHITQPGAISGGALSIEHIVPLISGLENIYSGTLWRLKG
jgi:hypothetical protein